MVCPQNEEMLHKIPPRVRDAIRAEAIADCIAAVEALRLNHTVPSDFDFRSYDSYGDIRIKAWDEALAALRGLDGAR